MIGLQATSKYFDTPVVCGKYFWIFDVFSGQGRAVHGCRYCTSPTLGTENTADLIFPEIHPTTLKKSLSSSR